MKKHKKAFTILELLVVIVISAVLISIVLPRIISYTKEARHNACRGQIAIVNEQVELYYVQVGEWPRADLMDMVWGTERFPDGMPRCSLTGYFYWIYEDTHRVGGHTENNPDSHKELGYMTIGDCDIDSQGNLLGLLKRSYDADGDQYKLTRRGNFVYGLMDDGETLMKIAYTEYFYNAYGSLTGQHNNYDIEYEKIDGVYKQVALKRKLENRREQLIREWQYTYFYDANGKIRNKTTNTIHYYQFSGGQEVKSTDYKEFTYTPDRMTLLGSTVISRAGASIDGRILGETIGIYGQRYPEGHKYERKLMGGTEIIKDGSGNKLATHIYTEKKYDHGTYAPSAWVLEVQDGDDKPTGQIIYWTEREEGAPVSQNWTFKDTDPDGNLVESHQRKTVTPPGIKWDWEHNKKEAHEQITTNAGDYAKKGYYMEYDNYSREKFVKQSFTNENGVLQHTREYSDYNYDDETTGLLKSVKTTVKNPDGSVRRTLDVAYDNYDDAGRLTAWSSEGINPDTGRNERLEKSRTFVGTKIVTGNTRKSIDEATGKVNYDYELTKIKRKVSGGMTSYEYTTYKYTPNPDTGVIEREIDRHGFYPPAPTQPLDTPLP